jgi:hypothetical protein
MSVSWLSSIVCAGVLVICLVVELAFYSTLRDRHLRPR